MLHHRYTQSSTGYLCVVAAALLWALSGTVSKFLFQAGISPFQLVQLRTTIAAGILLLCLALRNPSLLRVPLKDLPGLIVLGLGLAIAQFTYLYAISKIQVAAAILLQYQAPIIIAAHALLSSREKLTPFTLVALLGSASGCYLVVGAYSLDLLAMNQAGIYSGLASAALFAWYSVSSENRMRAHSPWTVVFYALLFASVLWNILHPPLDAFLHPRSGLQWLCIFFVGTGGTILSFGLYNEGIFRIRPTRAGITATLEPMAAALLAWLFLKEFLAPLQMAGAVLVVGSIILLQAGKERRPAKAQGASMDIVP